MKPVVLLLLTAILAGCSGGEGDIVIKTGPEIDILNIVEVGLSVNSEGQFVLAGDVSIPTPIHTEILDVNWNLGFEKVLNDASSRSNYLYVVWQEEDGIIHNEIYDIGKPFKINFERRDWVRDILNTGNGTIVVGVEKQAMLAESSWQPAQEQRWSNIVSVRMPTLNEIRDELTSIWDANLLDVNDILSPDTRTYNGTVDPNREYLWPYYWCTKNAQVLEDNIRHIKIAFYVDAEIVPTDKVFYYHYDTTNNWNCGYWATVVGGWPRDATLDMKLEYVFDAEVYDGVTSYPAGTYSHHLLLYIPK